jgi:hypothetical protein
MSELANCPNPHIRKMSTSLIKKNAALNIQSGFFVYFRMFSRKVTIRQNQVPPFKTLEFKRAAQKHFDAFAEEVYLEDNRIIIRFPWETQLAPQPFNILHAAVEKIEIRRVESGLDVMYTWQLYAKITSIITILGIFVFCTVLAIGSHSFNAYILCTPVYAWFLGYYYFLNRGVVKRVKRLMTEANAQL